MAFAQIEGDVVCDPEVDCLENVPSFSIDGISFTELHVVIFPILFLVITITIIIIIWKKYKKSNV